MAVAAWVIESTRLKHEILALEIMRYVMRHKRTAKSCAVASCQLCLAPHLHKVIAAIEAQEPIIFLLPAFPAKSPNPAKVLGVLPDMAEKLCLTFLNSLCEQIQTIYSPGARVLLCSDGRVFNDAVGIADANVTAYQHALSHMIKDLSCLSTFNLDDLYRDVDFTEMRHQLMLQHGESLATLKDSIRRGGRPLSTIVDEEVNRLYRGMTRFLVEDATDSQQFISRNALQNDCRARAYVVIQRSRAWSELIAERFPHAVRLSIHPQICGTSKLGIRLMEAENWMTPWHGVAVDINGRYVLLKRSQAEELGAQLVMQDGQPSHYALSK